MIDNDNFCVSVSEDRSNERPLPLAPSWRSTRMREGRQVGRICKGIGDETAGRIIGTMRQRSGTVPATSRRRIFCPIELNVKHGFTSIWAARLSDWSDLSIDSTAVFRVLRTRPLTYCYSGSRRGGRGANRERNRRTVLPFFLHVKVVILLIRLFLHEVLVISYKGAVVT